MGFAVQAWVDLEALAHHNAAPQAPTRIPKTKTTEPKTSTTGPTTKAAKRIQHYRTCRALKRHAT